MFIGTTKTSVVLHWWQTFTSEMFTGSL